MNDLPTVPDLERALAYALLMSRNAGDAVAVTDDIKPEWMTCDASRAIVETIATVRTNDLATVLESAKTRDAFNVEPASSFVTKLLADELGMISAAPKYIAKIREAHHRRQMIISAGRIASTAADMTDDAYREKTQQLISTIEDEIEMPATIAQIADGLLERLEKREAGEVVNTIPTNLEDINDDCPVRCGHTYVLAGLPGNGKTALALNMAKHAAENGYPSLVVSLEMKRDELCDRVLAAESNIPIKTIEDFGHKREMTASTRAKIISSASRLGRLPMHVVDAFETTPAGVAAQCRKHMREQPFRLLVLDYLQLLNADNPTRSRAADVGQCSRAMKNLATELDIAILVLCQLNREGSKADVPHMYHLKESSAIEQDASSIVFIHDPEPEEESNLEMELIVRKQRNGPKDFTISTVFRRAVSRFENAAEQRYSEFEQFS